MGIPQGSTLSPILLIIKINVFNFEFMKVFNLFVSNTVSSGEL